MYENGISFNENNGYTQTRFIKVFTDLVEQLGEEFATYLMLWSLENKGKFKSPDILYYFIEQAKAAYNREIYMSIVNADPSPIPLSSTRVEIKEEKPEWLKTNFEEFD